MLTIIGLSTELEWTYFRTLKNEFRCEEKKTKRFGAGLRTEYTKEHTYIDIHISYFIYLFSSTESHNLATTSCFCCNNL